MVKAVVVVGAEVTFWVDGAVWVGVSVDPCKGFLYVICYICNFYFTKAK